MVLNSMVLDCYTITAMKISPNLTKNLTARGSYGIFVVFR